MRKRTYRAVAVKQISVEQLAGGGFFSPRGSRRRAIVPIESI